MIGLAVAVLVGVACGRKPATLDVSPKKVNIYGIDRSVRLTARVLDKKGQPIEPATPTWSSSAPDVVRAESGGRLVAVKEGKATVTGTYEGVSTQVPVEIVDVSSIDLSPPLLHLTGPAGTTISLAWTVKNSHQATVNLKPTWTSADPKIATVSEDGRVTSVAGGTTTIVGRVGDVQGACDLIVSLRPIGRVELRPATALVRVGDSQRFQVLAYAPDGAEIPEVAGTFTSSNPGVASVTTSGVAEGRAIGAALIRVEVAGQTAEATLLVN
jgi:uncharacterized protein YjdB